jgi:spore coat protein CotH
VPLPFKPETHENDARPEFIVQLVLATNQPGGTAAFRSAIEAFLDLRQFLLWLAVERFVAEVDGFLSDYGGMNNYYLYRFDNQNRFSFIAWDKSEAFKGGSTYSIWRNITGTPAAQQNRLLARTLADREMYDAYLDALMETVRSAYSTDGSPDGRGWLELEIEREYAQIRDAVLADPQKTFTNADFERTVNDLRAFARERGEFVTREVNAARPD